MAYPDPTALVLIMDVMIRGSMRVGGGVVLFSWFYLIQFNLRYLCIRDLEENVDLCL